MKKSELWRGGDGGVWGDCPDETIGLYVNSDVR
jgi:hypothetical protein